MRFPLLFRIMLKNGFSVVRDLVGHGIGTHLHEDPEIRISVQKEEVSV